MTLMPFVVLTQGVVRILDAFGWHIAMDELIDSLYALKFDSLTYENKAEVMDFIKARVDKMMGSTPKILRKLYLQVRTFVVADMLEAASALVRSKQGMKIFKPSVESLSRAFNLAER